MRNATLPDLFALNDRLAAMAAAEVPLPPRLSRVDGSLLSTLSETQAALSRRLSEGESFDQSLAGEDRLTPAYKLLLQLTANNDDRATALLGSQRLASSAANASQVLSRAFVYPLVVCSLAYGGFILSCLFLVPALEQLYANLHLPAGIALQCLSWLRATFVYWIALPPLALAALAFQLRSKRRAADYPLFSWWPGMQRVIREQQYSALADTLAQLLTAGLPFDDAWQLATTAEASSARAGRSPADEISLMSCPPFLRWALWHSEPQLPRVAALRLASDLYYDSAERQLARLRLVAPVVIGVFFGGSVTLLYALTLFVPLAQLLRTIAS